MTGGNLRKATKELAREAEKGSVWIWLRRKLGKKQLTPKIATGDDSLQLQGVTGSRLSQCSATRRPSRNKGA